MADGEYEIPNDDNVTSEDIEPEADLSGADLSDADLSGANLSGSKLTNANLNKAKLVNTDLRNADLSNAELRGTDLSDALVDAADLSEAILISADLSYATLEAADLSDARLMKTNLSMANFQFAILSDSAFVDIEFSDTDFKSTTLSGSYLFDSDLSNLNFSNADLSNTNLNKSDLSGADIRFADLSDANIAHADLSDANLAGAELVNTDLRRTDLQNTNLSECEITTPRMSLETNFGTRSYRESDGNNPSDWDTIARTHHNLKIACNYNGLINQARRQHYLERRARGYEQKDAIDLNPWFTATWLGSFLSRVFIGYGVRVRRLLATMAILFVGSTAVYLTYGVGGDAAIDTISYSVQAFTVAPPTAPEQFLPHVVMMIETFFGTLSIVLLGYVLSNREQF